MIPEDRGGGGYQVPTSKQPADPPGKCGPNKKPSRQSERVCELVGEILCGAHDVARLKAFRAFEQIELDGLAFIQRAVSVLLDGGKMYEDILARGALDEPVSLRPVEPLHSTLLSHKNSFRLSARIYSSVARLSPNPTHHTGPWDTPARRDDKNLLVGVAAVARYCTNRNGSSEFRRTVVRDEKRWSREDEGAISHSHRNATLARPSTDSPTNCPVGEAPDNSRNISVGKS